MKFDRSFYTSGYNLIDPALYGEQEIDGFAAYYKMIDGNKHCAMVFFGKQSKPYWRYYFKTLEAALAKVKEASNSHKIALGYKAQRKAEKKSMSSFNSAGKVDWLDSVSNGAYVSWYA